MEVSPMVTLPKIINWASHNIWVFIIGALSLIEITPIKINPWNAIFRWIGDRLLGDTKKTVENLSKELKDNEKDRIRWEILDFANSCRNGRKHTKDEYVHILELDKKYRKLLVETKDENGVFDLEIKYIKKLYEERLDKNDFL